jgi:hypothetical protein
MAITEKYTSRSMHITREGTVLTQVFDCTDSDWNNWVALGKPTIGTQWSVWRPDLRVTDIKNGWESNTHCVVTVTYSTGGMMYPENRPDKVSSLREVYDYSYTPQTDFKFYNTDGASKDWEELWDEYKSGTPVPPRYPSEALITMQRSMNLTQWRWDIIRDSINHVNSDRWLNRVTGRSKPNENVMLGVSFDDIGKWLFAGFHSEKVGYVNQYWPNYEVTYTFLYYDDGWNTPYGITDIKAYDTAAFKDLPAPDDYDDSENIALR